MPARVYHAHVDDLPKESRYGNTYTRTGVVMDQATVNWVELSADFKPLDDGARPDHHHPFDMLIFQLSGEQTMMVGDEDFPMVAGDVIYIPSNATHTSRVTKGPVRMIEIFAPIRTDYLYLAEHQTAQGTAERNADGSRTDLRGWLDDPYAQ